MDFDLENCLRTRFSCCEGVYRSLSVVVQRLKLYRTFEVDASSVGVVIAQILRRLHSLSPLQTKEGPFVQPSILLRQWSETAGPIDIPSTGRPFSITFACNIYTISIQLGSFLEDHTMLCPGCHITRISIMQYIAFLSPSRFRSICTWDAASIRPVDVTTSRPVVGKRL